MRYAAKKDATHNPIADYLEGRGYIVFDVSGCAGLGFDLVVYCPKLECWGVTECKTPTPSRARSGARRYSMKNRSVQAPSLTASELKAASVALIAVAETGEQAERGMFRHLKK